MIRQGDVVLTF